MTAPTREIGQLVVLPSWNVLAGADPADPPAFQFPQRVSTVERMRTDPQIDALCSSLTMPIMRYRWELDPNGARDEVVEQTATDFGIPILGNNDPAPRSRRRFKHRDHLEHALLALWHGFMMFEQVPDTERFDLARDGWRLRKLAPRMPSTIDRLHVASDGGFAGLTQYGYQPPPRAGRSVWGVDADPQIGVNSLLAYVWRREGANWYGRSMLRPLYRDWILKDRALRVDAIKNERFGVGIPTATAPEGGDPAQYSKLAQAVRASETSGVGLPAGASVGIEGIRGTLPDVMASVRYYDESMARSFMAMVIQLGQTQTGSRALGNTFADHFQMLVEAVADWYKDTTNEHAIEDYVDWNWSEDEQAPLLKWSYAEHSPLAVADLVAMTTAGVITMDTTTEQAIRKQTQLPPLPESGRPALPVSVEPVAASRLPFVQGVSSGIVAAHSKRGKDGKWAKHGKHGDAKELSENAASDWVDDNGSSWMAGLSSDERTAVEGYSSIGGSWQANDALRSGTSPDEVMVGGVPSSVLNSAINRSSFDEDIVVWRGSQSGSGKAFSWSDNPDPGIVSTSAARDVAEGYIDTDDPSHTLYKITIRKGVPAAAVHSDLSAASEAEVLLPMGTKVSVGTMSTPKNKAAIVEVEVNG